MQSRRGARSPRRTTRDPSHPPGLGFTPRGASPPPRSPLTKPPTPPKKATPARTGLALPCIAYVAAYHALFAGALVAWHARTHGVVSPTQALLALFLVINVWICVCELSLLAYPLHIRAEAASFASRYGPHTLPPVFLFQPVRLGELLSLKYWSVMWSTYSALDPSYTDTTTFGYCVDVCNGMSTLLPSVACAVGMTYPVLSPRVLGMLGLVSYYQELYGTLVYYFQFFFNRRHAKLDRSLVLGIVLPANAIWVALPALGMWASSRLIRDGTYDVFLSGFAV